MEAKEQQQAGSRNPDNAPITTAELAKRLAGEEKLVLLDIRDEADFDEVRIANALHSDWRDVAQLLADGVLPADKDVVVICYSGKMSGQVSAVLNAEGITAYSLQGGMQKWLSEGRPHQTT